MNALAARITLHLGLVSLVQHTDEAPDSPSNGGERRGLLARKSRDMLEAFLGQVVAPR